MSFGQNIDVRSKKALKNAFFLHTSQNTPPTDTRMIKIAPFFERLVQTNQPQGGQLNRNADSRIWFIFFCHSLITLKRVVILGYFQGILRSYKLGECLYGAKLPVLCFGVLMGTIQSLRINFLSDLRFFSQEWSLFTSLGQFRHLLTKVVTRGGPQEPPHGHPTSLICLQRTIPQRSPIRTKNANFETPQCLCMTFFNIS